MVKAIIFDVDGVIFNSTDSAGNFLWSANIERDLGIKIADLRKIFSSAWLNVIKGEIDTKVHFEKTLLPYGVSAEKFIDYWLKNDDHINQNVLNIIQEIRQPVYLGTNQETYRAAHLQSMIGDYFKKIFSSCEIGAVKPEEAFYAHIERELELPSSNLLFIDDTEANISAAQNRGWNTYHFKGDLNELRRVLGD